MNVRNGDIILRIMMKPFTGMQTQAHGMWVGCTCQKEVGTPKCPGMLSQ